MNFQCLTYLMVALLGLMACSEGGPVATGSLTNGTPQSNDAGEDDDNPPDVTQPPTVKPPPQDAYSPPPTFSDHFATATNSAWKIKDPYGTVTYAVADSLASDQKVARLTFNGGVSNAAGPGNSTEIYTSSLLGFGMYRARFNFAKCNAGEDLMNGIFVYSNDGVSDTNSNGIIDNNEIDIELLCGSPQKLYLTTWTDYQYNDATKTETIKKVTRVIDLNTGKAYETPPGKEGTYEVDYDTVKAIIPEMALPKLATDDAYYEMGFEWRSNLLRYFIVLNGKEVTLWNYTDATYIPQNKVKMMFNLWYPAWSGKAYPASAQSLKVDWFKYWAAP